MAPDGADTSLRCRFVLRRQEFVRARAQRGPRLIAVIVSDCYWQGIPDVSRFQVLPKDRNNNVKPIKSFEDRDNAWAGVIKAIADLLEDEAAR
jgi:hypothetical protein